jgi:hypothetical protein
MFNKIDPNLKILTILITVGAMLVILIVALSKPFYKEYFDKLNLLEGELANSKLAVCMSEKKIEALEDISSNLKRMPTDEEFEESAKICNIEIYKEKFNDRFEEFYSANEHVQDFIISFLAEYEDGYITDIIRSVDSSIPSRNPCQHCAGNAVDISHVDKKMLPGIRNWSNGFKKCTAEIHDIIGINATGEHIDVVCHEDNPSWSGEFIESEKNSKGEEFIPVPMLGSSDTRKRIKEFASRLDGSPIDEDIIEDTIDVAEENNVDIALPFCIAFSDSQLGTQGRAKQTNNPCNIGNDDSGGSIKFDSWSDGMRSCVTLLNRPQYKNTDMIGHLSKGGRKALFPDGWNRDYADLAPSGLMYWASSEENWNKNVLRCMRTLHDEQSINEFYKFR